MPPFLKWILSGLKTPLANVVSTLQANRTANIAAIEATVGQGGNTIETAVTGFIASEVKKVPALAIFVPIAEPPLLGEIAVLVQQGTNTVPELYDAGVALLVKEEAEV